MSAAETDRNVTFRAPASAQANDVLAHPGGPYSKTPEKISVMGCGIPWGCSKRQPQYNTYITIFICILR